MEQITVTRSIISSKAFGEVIKNEYAFDGPLTCKLISKMLRTQDNDHYLVRAGDKKYVARIYQLGQHLNRKESEYLFELDWLDYLRRNDGAVSYPIARPDGTFLGRVNAPEGVRYYALFSFAKGKPLSATNEEQLFNAGSNMARIHLLSNSYESVYDRQPVDLAYLVDRAVEPLMGFWESKHDEKLDILLTSASEAKAEILTLMANEESTEDSWGPIGGDFHPHSTHVDEQNQPSFFGFDLCGYGWRAYDIAVFLLNANLMSRSSELSEAFFAGYYSVRPLSRNEHEAISPFLTIRRVWLTGAFSNVDHATGYTFIGPAQMDV